MSDTNYNDRDPFEGDTPKDENGFQDSTASGEGPYGPNSSANGQQPGWGPGNQQQGSSYQYNPNAGWAGGSSADREEYKWNFADYESASEPPKARAKRSRGFTVFASILCVVLVIGVLSFAGYGVYSMVGDRDQKNVDSSSSQTQMPGLSIQEKPATSEQAAADGSLTTTQIIKKVKPSVVGIVTYQGNNSFASSGAGSGIIMTSDGYILTNAHVVEKAVGIKVVLDNGEEYSASLIGSDTRTDIAVIKIEAQNLTYADFGNSDQVEEGERVVAIGNPTGMQLAGSTTQGIISALDRAVKSENGYTMRFLQTDAAINPGNSGGPLVNEFGQVIGINSAKYVNEGYEGIGFAIPINDALPIVEQLITNGKVTGRPMLGITGEPIDSVLSRMYSVPTGVHILSVDPNADIASKNVVPGDIITQVNGTAVASADDISQVLDGFKPGDKVKLTIYRRSNSSVGGRTFEVSVTLMSDNGDGTVSPASK